MIIRKPNRVAILLPSLKFGGAERVALNLAKALQEEGVEIHFLLMSSEGEYLAEADRHFRVVNLSCNRTYKLPGKLLAYLLGNRPDALISSFWKLNLCACLARMFYPELRLLLWEHSQPSKSKNSPAWLYAISASLFYQLSTKVVAVSTGVSKDIQRITVGLRRKLVVILNPIVPPAERLLSQHERSTQKQVIWVGRLDIRKNPSLMIEAFSLIFSTCDARLVFVGDGQMRSELEQKCKAFGLDERVSFLGYMKNPYEVMVTSDLLVLTSDREGLGNVIIEAMFCGLRVVSTDCGEGIHDILLDGQYGTIVPVGNKVTMARAIECELREPHDTKQQIFGAQRFLPSVIAQEFLAVLRG
ncbi:MAG: glycosyltransferase [Candidatus Saccharimonadales bacterium]